jgi:predicted ester cyclase
MSSTRERGRGCRACTPDYVAHVPIVAQPLRGIDAWPERAANCFAAFPDLHIKIEDLIAEGEQVAARTTWRGTHRGVFLGVAPTGKVVAVTGIRIWRIARRIRAAHQTAGVPSGS